MREFDYYLPSHRKVPPELQQVARRATLAIHEHQSAEMKAQSLQMQQLKCEYAEALRSILGASKIEEFRSTKADDLDTLQPKSGDDGEKITALKAEYGKKVHLLHSKYNKPTAPDHGVFVDPPIPCQKSNDEWTVYSPPYDGFFWSFEWERSDEPDDPELSRIIESSTGQIGSTISTRLSGADNDDSLSAQYYTAFKIWHQVQADGHLEAYMALRANDLAFSQSAHNEWGFSYFTLSQFTTPELRIMSPDETWEIKRRVLYYHFEHQWNEIPFDKLVYPANDIHLFHFKSDKIYSAGSWVLLEAAIFNMTWFTADDYSIETLSKVDLTLDSISIKSSM